MVFITLHHMKIGTFDVYGKLFVRKVLGVEPYDVEKLTGLNATYEGEQIMLRPRCAAGFCSRSAGVTGLLP